MAEIFSRSTYLFRRYTENGKPAFPKSKTPSCRGNRALLGIKEGNPSVILSSCSCTTLTCRKLFVSPFLNPVFFYQDWAYAASPDPCDRCRKPLAYHGLADNGQALVSCPRCDPGRTFCIPHHKKHENSKGGRPALPATATERKTRLQKQWKTAQRRKRQNKPSMS